MKLFRLEAENIFSLGKVEVDLENRGLILITGYSEDEGSSNGAGKSSVSTKAILWTLFGQIPEDMRADDVVNRHTKEKLGYGKLLFYDNSDRFCIIERKRGKTNRLRFIVEDKDVSCRNQKETQELINQTIGRDFNTFIQSDFFGQGREMSYAALPPKQQKEVLEQILPMEACDNWAEYAKQQYKKVDELVGVKERDVHTTSIKITTLRGQHDTIMNSSINWKQAQDIKLNEKTQKLNTEEERIQSIKDKIVELQNSLEQYSLLENYNETVQKKTTLEFSLNEAKSHFEEAKNTLHGWSHNSRELNNRLEDLNSKIKDSICPTCERDLPEEHKIKIKNEIDKLTLLKIEADKNATEASTACSYWFDESNKRQNELSNVINKINKYLNNTNHINDIKSKIERLTLQIGSNAEVLKAQIEELKKEKDPFIKDIEIVSKEISSLNKTEKEQTKALKLLEQERDDLLFWHNMYGKDLKLRLFEAACPFLDTRTAYYLTALSNDQIHVEFSSVKRLANGDVKEEFSVRAWSDTGGASYGSLSGGEKKITSFAIGLALADLAASQTSGNTNLLILDEPFEQLDERNSEMIVQYLKDVCNKSTILLVSNEDHLKQLIPNRINIVKRRGVSTIE